MLTTFDVLKHYGIATTHVRLVRHGDMEIPVLYTFREDRKRFEAYQSFQRPNRFGNAKHIAVFSPLQGYAALFLGLWDVVGKSLPNSEWTKAHRALIDKFQFPLDWNQKCVWYDLKLNGSMAELSERLVIDWGRGTLAFVQLRDKPVLEIRRPNSIGDFVSYSAVTLGYYELRQLMTDGSSNLTWRSALSSVNGVYLVRDKATGKLYVGSAYGKEGIYGRWKDYATTGHGGNAMLIGMDHSNFEFSILEIAAPTLSAIEVILIEQRWKDRLGTRNFHLDGSEGLNAN